MTVTAIKRSAASRPVNQRKTSPSSFSKNEQLFFLFSYELLYKVGALCNTGDHRNHQTSTYLMADILLWLKVLCEWGRNMCVLLLRHFNGEHFFYRIVGHQKKNSGNYRNS